MKTRIYWLAGALLICCLLGWTGLGQSTRTPKPAWEYKVIPYFPIAEADLNKLGADGWELVQFHSGTGDTLIGPPQYLFKRAK